MLKKRGIIWTAIILAVFLIFYFDVQIVKGISLINNAVLNDFFLGITFISSEIIIFFFLTSLFLWHEHKRKWILPLWITLGTVVVISFLLKVLVHRLRPFQIGIVSILPSLESTSYLIWNFSFPSFQSMLAFCAIPILSKEFPKFKYIWIILASLIAFSRVYFGLHFMSDVLVGGIIGYLIGVGIIKIENKTKFGERIWKRVF
ncbi:MAG: phosphatase PAP2 family protein [Nanoarchaeota archaeon]|nr:phosphatase PAP2 family protein [Nanoarchaeota archaeon]